LPHDACRRSFIGIPHFGTLHDQIIAMGEAGKQAIHENKLGSGKSEVVSAIMRF
jgi:hypothetical protein